MARMRMEVKQCNKGHFYSGEYETCPFCSGDSGRESVNPDWEPTMETAKVPTKVQRDTSTMNRSNSFEVEEYEVTTPVYLEMDTVGYDPVVGWLVCIQGPNRGQAYRLHNGTNFIGRGEQMDVCIENDIKISSKNAASISYDDRSKIFFLERGDGRNNVYLNGSVLRRAEDVARYDRIIIGGSEFLFVPLCGECFDWKSEAERQKQSEKITNHAGAGLLDGYGETV